MVTLSAEELGTMSKNNLRGITLGKAYMGDSLSYLDLLLGKTDSNDLNPN